METIGQVVLAPIRRTNDSHAILIAEIADLRKACAEMRALLGVYLNRAQSMLSCDSRSHDRGEIAALEHALSSDCGKDYVHRSELAAAQKEIARLTEACAKEFSDAQAWSDEVCKLRAEIARLEQLLSGKTEVAPVERQKELAEVFVETYCPLTKYSQDWKWEIADEFCRNNIRAATRAVLEEAFRRLEANQNALYKPAYQMWKTDAHNAVCYDVYYLRACKDFLLAGLTSSSANVSPQDSMNKL